MGALYFVLMYSNGGLFFLEVVFILPFNTVIFYNIVTVAERCYCNRVNIYRYIVQQGTKKNINRYFKSSF